MAQSFSKKNSLLTAATGITLDGTSGADELIGTDDDDVLNGLDDDDVLRGLEGSDTLSGGMGNDLLHGALGDDTLRGDTGNDALFGEEGNDTLDGGAGNDTLTGGGGSDTYLFGRGSGQDRIDNTDYYGYGTTDRIVLGAGIASADVSLSLTEANGLVLRIKGTDDRLTGLFGIDEIVFADGTVWDAAAMLASIVPTGGHDIVYGTDGDDVIDGLVGNDILHGLKGNDTLIGGVGHDVLYGGEGVSILNGGAGNDTLWGNASTNTTYLFGLGSGHDTFYCSSVGTDRLVLGAGITADDVIVRVDDQDLVLSFDGATESIRVRYHFSVSGRMPLDFIEFADGTVWNEADILAAATRLTEGDDNYLGTAGDDVVDGLGGNDRLDGKGGNDTMRGGTGSDSLIGGTGNDKLNGDSGTDYLDGGEGGDILGGGAGNDYLSGGAGNDTYLFGRGSGADSIYNRGGGTDKILLGAGITTNDLTLRALDETLILQINGTAQSLTLYEYFYYGVGEIDSIEFADGTIWNPGDILANIHATEGNDTLYGTAGDDVIDGLGGNDTLHGRGGNDTLRGGAGNDTLSGDEGDDILDGGAGNDSLWATESSGNTTFLFGLGSGRDTIYNSSGGTDRLVLGAGITTENVTLNWIGGESLVLKLNGTADSVTVSQHFYYNHTEEIHYIEFADGTVWDQEDILANIQASDAGDILIGTDGDDVIDALGGDDTLRGLGGNDTLYGRGGDDALYGGGGNDTLDGGTGSDGLYGEAGNDTYLFGMGSGWGWIHNEGVGTDRILMRAGIATDDVTLTRNEDNALVLTIDGTEDTMLVIGHFASAERAIDNIEFADGTVWDVEDIQAHLSATRTGGDLSDAVGVTLDGTSGADELVGTAGDDALNGLGHDDVLQGLGGNDTLSGGTGNDALFGAAGDDVLIGSTGNDTIYGGLGADRLNGGAGDDFLQGEGGSDTFLFNRGDGQDTIFNADSNGTITINRLVLGAGIAATDVTVRRNADDDLVLKINGTDDRVTVTNHFTHPGTSAIDKIVFADGTVWSIGDILANIRSTEGHDVLEGGAGHDTIYGLGGNDILRGLQGHDTLDGGAGNDILEGGQGNNRYLFGRGSGQDTYYCSSGAEDRLVLGAGIAADDLIVLRDRNDLFVSIDGTTDEVRVEEHFVGSASQLDIIEFADGTIWDSGDILAAILPTEGDDEYYGTDDKNVIEGLGGNDVLYGQGGDDTLDGGAGNDRLHGEADNDILDGGAGADFLYGGKGNDTYRFGIGSGQDMISYYHYDEVGGTDRVVLDAGITTNDVILRAGGHNLLLKLKGTDDVLKMAGYFSDDNDIAVIRFADGTVWDRASVKANLLATEAADILYGTAGDDVMSGLGGNDSLSGLGGNDTLNGDAHNDGLYGGSGNDLLNGGGHSDNIHGGSGNDTLQGGVGNDVMKGGGGSDTYLFGLGHGADIIRNRGDSSASDRLLLGSGITTDDVTLTRNGDSLFVSIDGTSDSIWVGHHYAYAWKALDTIEFADGTVWDLETMAPRLIGINASAADAFG